MGVSNGSGSLSSPSGITYNHLFIGPSLGDCTLSCAFTSSYVVYDQFGLHFRYVDDNNAYRFRIEPQQLNLIRTVNGTSVSLGTAPFTPVNGTSYTLKVVVAGGSIQCKAWVTGSSEPAAFAISVNDFSLPTGRVGLYIEPNSTTHPILFTNFTTTAPSGSASTVITRNGSVLLNGTSSFYAVGLNAYWLGLAESPVVGYPSQFEILDALQTAKEMGATVVRSHTLGISYGTPFSIWPTINGPTNTQAFATIDYAIFQASLLGLRVQIPLLDNYAYYHGGKHTFTDYRGVPESTFYTDANVLADFKAYLGVLLTHVNQYSGIAYKDDPTIFAWETGNELVNPLPPPSWTNTIATTLKGLGARQLILDGSYGVNTNALSLATVDLYSNHYYPPNIGQMQSDTAAVNAASKAFLVGEYDWTNNIGGTAVATTDSSTAPPGNTQSLTVVVSQAASFEYYAQVLQSGLSLVAGDTYTVSFWAQARVPYTIGVAVQEYHDAYQLYSLQHFTLSTTWTQYTWSFTAPANDGNAFLAFNVGLAATTTWLGAVRLVDTTAAGAINLIQDPTFATVAPWQVNNKQIDSLPSFLSAMKSTPLAGDLWWNLQPHGDTSGYIPHADGYSLYYPGTTPDMQSRGKLLRAYAYARRGTSPAPDPSPVTAPVITGASVQAATPVVTVRGVVGGSSYAVERSNTGANGPYTVLAQVADSAFPLADTTPVQGAPSTWYRTQAYNVNGIPGPYSTPVHLLAHAWDTPMRLRLRASRGRDTTLRLRLHPPQGRDTTLRVRLVPFGVTPPASGTPSPTNASLFLLGLSQVPMAHAPPGFAGIAVNGSLLAQQPVEIGVPGSVGSPIPVGAVFSLVFVSPTPSVQSALASGSVVTLSIVTCDGVPVTVPVTVQSALSLDGTCLCVACTVTSTTAYARWVFPSQFC